MTTDGIRDSLLARLCSGHARKPLELPTAVARNFVRDMRAFFAEKNAIKADEIAARQAWTLNQHLGPRDKTLR
jgi:hypothetical protein